MATVEPEASYIDYTTFLSPTFTATTHANTLVTRTNNASDTSVDLTTPLSKVLFDLQEIDTHIHDLTTKSALPLLQHTKTQSSAARAIVLQLESQIRILTENYARLEHEVVQRHATAEEVRLAASRLWVTVKIGRSVSRALVLGRTLEREMAELSRIPSSTSTSTQPAVGGKEDATTLVQATYTLQTLRALFNATGRDEEGEHLSRINVLQTLKTDLLAPSELKLRNRAQQIIREFSLSSLSTTTSTATTTATNVTAPQAAVQAPATKNLTTSSLQTLYLLSTPGPSSSPIPAEFTPHLLINALTTYLSTSLTSSTASLTRALSTLPTLPRALSETSARCQNIIALSQLLSSTVPPIAHPLLDPAVLVPSNLLTPLLAALDTSSLPSYFWRSLSSQIAPKVSEVVGKGGVNARNLRAGRDKIRGLCREAVLQGVRGEKGVGAEGGWEREVAVFVGAVAGALR